MKLLCVLVLSAMALVGCQNVKQDNYQDAGKIEYLEGLVTEFPDDPNAHLQLGKAYLYEAKVNKSEVFLKQAITAFERYVQLVPEDLSVKFSLYDLYYRQVVMGDYSYEEKLNSTHLQIPKQYRDEINPPSLAVVIHKLSNNLFENYDSVTDVLKQAITEAPYNITSNIMLADFYSKQGLHRLAVPLLMKINKHTPNNPLVVEFLGVTLMEQNLADDCKYSAKKTFSEAQKYLREAAKLNPDSAKVRESLSTIYEFWGRGNLQLNEAKRMVEIENNSNSKRVMANAYLSSGRLDEAEIAYQSLLNTDQKLEALTGLSQLYFYQSAWEKSQQSIDELASSNNAYFYDYLLKSLSSEQLNGHVAARKEFILAVDKLNLKPWEQTLFDYRIGSIPANELLNKAGDVCEQTEAEFYVGFTDYLNGNSVSAKARMEKVLALKVYAFVEYHGAKAFIKQW